MGGKTQRGWIGSTVKRKGRAVFGIGIPAWRSGKRTLYPYHLSVGDFPCHEIKNPKIGTNSRKTSTIFSG